MSLPRAEPWALVPRDRIASDPCQPEMGSRRRSIHVRKHSGLPVNSPGAECHSSPLGKKPCPSLFCQGRAHACLLTVAGAQHTHMQTSPNTRALWLQLLHVKRCSVLLESTAKGLLFLFPPSLPRGSLPGMQHCPPLISLPSRAGEEQSLGLPSPFTQALATGILGRDPGAGLPVVSGPAASPRPWCPSRCPEEASPSQLCWGEPGKVWGQQHQREGPRGT